MEASVTDAKNILAWIMRQAEGQFSVSKLLSDLRSSIDSRVRAEEAISVLVDHGYLREVRPNDSNKKGRKPSPRYDVNPHICGRVEYTSKNTRNTENVMDGDEEGWVYFD